METPYQQVKELNEQCLRLATSAMDQREFMTETQHMLVNDEIERLRETRDNLIREHNL